MRTDEQVCGTCRYHRYENGDWICVNGRSEYDQDWTGYEDTCDEWEER